MKPAKITLATFPLPDREEPYWQVHVGGMPVIRETTSQTDATAVFHQLTLDALASGQNPPRAFWDGYNAQETIL